MSQQTRDLFEYEDEMKRNAITVRATWDDEAGVWVAQTDDIVGLAAEGATLEALTEQVHAMIPQLIERNGLTSELAEAPVRIVAVQSNRVVDPVS
jgi:predicted RNase H-like HicB family nuclease